jgi:alkanesulfonate monooxygenase SsuD/methylene tetrahydromethanopterin reductase-like flavin-dependent oxidoreductase (luciferase family)
MTDHLTYGGQLTGGSRAMTGLQSALWLPLFGDLADPVVVARLAAEAEEAGWHGMFVWDHLRWQAPVRQVADPWITLAVVAAATERLRLGPMVTPLARRRPAKVARETVTLDWLSGGRLTLGVGLGSDRFGGELSATGEQLDDRRRSQMLDEALQILTGAWSGQSVHHHGEHYTIDGIQFLPRPVRQRVPVWVAGFPGNLGPVRRAARHDGFFPVNVEQPRSARRDRRRHRRPAPAHDRPLRHCHSPATRHRPCTLRRSGRHLVACRIPARDRLAEPGTRRDPRRPGCGGRPGCRCARR